MVNLFNFDRKLQRLMHSFKMKVSCETTTCLPSIIAQPGTLKGPAGLLGFKFPIVSKQSFSDTAQKQETLPTVTKGFSFTNLPK